MQALQQWDQAFEAFSQGAAARRATVEFDEQAEIAMFDYLKEHYTRAWFDHLPEGNPDASPIFVLGQPRTGTTLIERIITSHSQVHSAGELQQLGLALRRLSNYRDLMQVWHERFPGQIFDISYEDTARDLEPNARALLDYLELPWEDACLDFHQQDGAVSTASAVQVREPAHTRSIGRWRRYEDQLQPMVQALQSAGVIVK
jgi:hypothetical protein